MRRSQTKAHRRRMSAGRPFTPIETRLFLPSHPTVDRALEKRATEILQQIENDAEAVLRSVKKPGQYSNPAEINEMYLLLFNFYEKHFHEHLAKIPLLQGISFLLKKYETYFEEFHRTKKLPADIPNAFGDPPSVQDGLLYAMEQLLVAENLDELDLPERDLAIHMRAMELCATHMAGWGSCSDQIHGVYRNDTIVTIHPSGEKKFFTSKITPSLRAAMRKLDEDVNSEFDERKKLLGGTDLPMELDTRRKILDEPLKQGLGVTFEEKRQMLIQMTRAPFDHIHIYPADKIVSYLCQKTGFSAAVVERVINGVLITKEKLTGDHPIWLINARENRITRRPIMGMMLRDGFHYAWSKGMTKELLNYFNGLMIYRGFPSEWATPPVKQAIEDLSLEVSSWFEDAFAGLLRERGFQGGRARNVIGRGTKALRMPVGEIDFLGFHNELNLLIVMECKLVKWSSNPRQDYDDFKLFIDTGKPGKKSYSDKLTEKFNWVYANADQVVAALQTNHRIQCTKPFRVAHAIITYQPMRISILLKNFPCLSFVRFIRDFEAKKDWPYSSGIQVVS